MTLKERFEAADAALIALEKDIAGASEIYVHGSNQRGHLMDAAVELHGARFRLRHGARMVDNSDTYHWMADPPESEEPSC